MTGIRCALMRGGTSKGAYFAASDLPSDSNERGRLLLRVLGSPHPRQIDGVGGGHPLTSKVAVVTPSVSGDADVDYLFLQVGVDEATVSDRQNCGNLLAGVGPFALARGMLPTPSGLASVRIRMLNSGDIATASFRPPAPGDEAEVVLSFGEPGGKLLPTGGVRDWFGGIEATCVDAGMPVVLAAAASFNRTGYESIAELEADGGLRERVGELRLAAAHAMGLGDVRDSTIPKITLVAPPQDGGNLCTRTYIPIRLHETIGVLGAVSVAVAARLPGSVAADVAHWSDQRTSARADIEHPGGHMLIDVDLDAWSEPPELLHAGVVRTARLLFDGTVYPRSPDA